MAGLSASPHCGLMCGPLACALGTAERRVGAAVGWHLGRLAAYAGLGAVAGGVGQGAVALSPNLLRAFPWVMAAGLLLSALDVVPWFRRVGATHPITAGAWRAASARTAKLSPAARAAAFGALTPLLPCGVLYGVLIAAAATGTAAGGAALMGAFVLGSAPALGLVQTGVGQLGRSAAAAWARRAVLVAGALVLAWRGWHAPPTLSTAPECHAPAEVAR